MHDNVWIELFWYITLLCGVNDWQKKILRLVFCVRADDLHAGLIPLRVWIICLLHLYLSPTYCLIRVCHVVVLVYFDFKVLCQNMWMYWTAVNRQVEALCPPVCSTSCRLLSPHQPYSVQVCPRVTLPFLGGDTCTGSVKKWERVWKSGLLQSNMECISWREKKIRAFKWISLTAER